MKLNTNRMETLVDGIFAIVMTVMMISFNEILSSANLTNNADCCRLFLSLKDDFIAYVVSFLILGALWLEHHWQFHFIKRIDPILVLINVIWFIFLCLIPFSTMLLGNYYNFIAPVLIFEFNVLIAFLVLHIHWAYATRQGRLTETPLDSKMLSKHRKIGLLPVFFMLFAIVATLIFSVIRRG